VISVDDLCRFFNLPVRTLMQQRLGIYLYDGDEELEQSENFSLDTRTANDLVMQLVNAELQGNDFDSDLLRVAVDMPHSPMDNIYSDAIKEQSRNLLELCPERHDIKKIKLNIFYSFDSITLSDQLYFDSSNGDFTIIDSNLLPWRLLQIWIRYLALLVASDHSLNCQWIEKSGDNIKSWRFLAVDDPEYLLSELLACYQKGMSIPLQFEPATSFEYINKDRDYDKAAVKFKGGYMPGRWEKSAYLQRVWPDCDSFLDDNFMQLAETILSPMFDHMEQLK
jgi:exonuclease V gamma subunit